MVISDQTKQALKNGEDLAQIEAINAAYCIPLYEPPPEQAEPNGKLVAWWNGITPGYDGQGVPSIRWGADAENSGHDIPLYDGFNPIHYQQPAQAVDLGKIIEQIAQQWDGCNYDAVGETIDIGPAIRAAGKRLVDSNAAQAVDRVMQQDAARWRAIAPHLSVEWDEDEMLKRWTWIDFRGDALSVPTRTRESYASVEEAIDAVIDSQAVGNG
ncbi:MAG: hypothetical protein ACN6PX_07410 [Stenotrophomonas lactitubi]|uniref:hypothetical protein n=1 Tax=Stenotrophomonas lactitubi TaxID=2045214 RepID=UPI003D13A3B7